MDIRTGVYKVSKGTEIRNEIFILDNNKWRYVSSEQALFQAGYSWGDVQTIPVEEWCPYEVGYPMPGGWADTSDYGYYPHKDWYIEACAVAPVFTCPQCGATFGSQAELDEHIATAHPPVYTCFYCGATFGSQAELDAHTLTEHPSPEMPLPIPPPYKIAWGAALSWYRKLAELGCNIVQGYMEWHTDEQISNAAAEALKNGMQLLAHCSTEDNVSKYTARFNTHKNNPGIWGWQVEEPQMRDISIDALKQFYKTAKTINPNWKIFVVFGFGEWCRRGYATGGICDVVGPDIGYWSTRAGLTSVLTNNYEICLRKMIDDYGCEFAPVIMAFDYENWVEPNVIRMNHEVYRDRVDRGEVQGLGYYKSSAIMATPELQAQVKEENRVLGGYSPIFRVITTKTVLHDCEAVIEYQFSSIAVENMDLTCPYDSHPLGVKGIPGSEVIKDVSRIIARVRAEIAQLVIEIANLQVKIVAIQAEIAEIKQLLGI